MTSKLTITRERAQQIFLGNGPEPSASEERELARMALAAMDSEPVYQVFEPSDGRWVDVDDEEEMIRLRSIGGETRTLYTAPPSEVVDSEPVAWLLSGGGAKNVVCFDSGNVYADPLREVTPLYRHAQPAPERDQVRREHAEWSQVTFGNVGPIGPLKHLSKEALEAAAEPGDLSEWADMQFLMWDAQRRAGITDEQITQAMIEKLAVNKLREWPAPKDGEPRLHIKEQPKPVVTFYRDGIEAAAKWIDKQREAYDSEHGWSDPDTGAFEFGNDAQRDYSATLEEIAEGIRGLHPNTAQLSQVVPDEKPMPEASKMHAIDAVAAIAEVRGWNACRAAMLQAGTLTNEDTRQVDELTMWIKRLVRSLKNANPDSKLPREAMDYLTAKGLISVGDILR